MNPDEASAETVQVERLLSDLARLRLEPHRASLRYRLGLLMVAVFMVILPMIYLTALALGGWWLLGRLLDPPAVFEVWASLAYLSLAVLGPVCMFFLIKPWFMRRPVDEGTVPLKLGEAPDLECFVGLLAHAVGAPGPAAIELDCSVNAAAGFRGGWRGVWRQELKLTLGLPLIAGLDMRSFAGVLAHELGHFAQRAGMRLAWFIMLVNEWFARLVHSRDRWDRRLQEGTRSERPGVKLFSLAALSLVWLARQPLRLLKVAGRWASGYALREMEFDADGYEIVFAGSDAFRSTSREINLLNVGSAKALRLLGEAMPEGRLPRNLPALARKHTDGLSDRVRAAVEEEMMAESARFALFKSAPSGAREAAFFSTHPSDRERIEMAESYGAPGLVHSHQPATVLFADFETAAERLTEHFYGMHFPSEADACKLVDNARFDGTVSGREKRFEACERFFDGSFTVARPLLFPSREIKTVLAGHYESDPDAAQALRRWLVDGRAIFEQFEKAEESLVGLARAAELFQAGFRIRRKAFGLPRGLAALSDRQREASGRRDQALVWLADFDMLSRRCLLSATAEHLNGASTADQTRTRRVLHALAAMGEHFPTLLKLRRRVLAQQAILQNLTPASMGRTLVERLQRNSAELSDLSSSLRAAMSGVRYPFDHGAGRLSVATYATADSPDRRVVVRSYRSAEALLERLFDLYFRLVGHLCVIAIEAE